MRQITVDLSEILDLVASAQDYGFDDDVFMCSMADFTGVVTDDEIKEFADAISQKEGYSDEDGECVSERVTEWRNKNAKRVTP